MFYAPIFGRSYNPIRTGEGRLSPPITTGPLNGFHLPASLDTIVNLLLSLYCLYSSFDEMYTIVSKYAHILFFSIPIICLTLANIFIYRGQRQLVSVGLFILRDKLEHAFILGGMNVSILATVTPTFKSNT